MRNRALIRGNNFQPARDMSSRPMNIPSGVHVANRLRASLILKTKSLTSEFEICIFT